MNPILIHSIGKFGDYHFLSLHDGRWDDSYLYVNDKLHSVRCEYLGYTWSRSHRLNKGKDYR
jgi:hypothetical protein